jgi:predicted acyltransferase
MTKTMAQLARQTNAPILRVERDPLARTQLRAPSPRDAEGRSRDRRQTGPIEVRRLPALTRAESVDALRGFAMFWILGGDALAWSLRDMSVGKSGWLAAVGTFIGDQFDHVPWEGLTFYDLILPLFMFIVGVSIVFSLTRLVEREGKVAAHRRVLRRALLLFALGVLYYGGVSAMWPDIRLLGVLQRIALCYLFASLLFLNLPLRGVIVAFASLLVGYWALMTFVPVPGVGAGSLAEGENLANWVDMQYLPGMKWDGGWDPEGLLSTLPAIATCLLGVFAGLVLLNARVKPRQKSLWLIVAGVALVTLGLFWGSQFPIIKKIWTSSFVLVTGGLSLVLLGLFHHLIDVCGYKAWSTIFMWIGANAIALYLVNNVANFQELAKRLAGGDVAAFLDRTFINGTGAFIIALVALVLSVALAGFLYRRKIFLRV